VDAPVKNDINYNADMSKGGVKHDNGKLQWHLLPMRLLEGVVEVLMAGARKYAAWNWTRGMPYTRALNAAQRHINAFSAGEDFDQDSGQHHIDHALCCLIFLRHFTLHGADVLDDRFDLTTSILRPEAPKPLEAADVMTTEEERAYDPGRLASALIHNGRPF
jgi:hypothetical protein